MPVNVDDRYNNSKDSYLSATANQTEVPSAVSVDSHHTCIEHNEITVLPPVLSTSVPGSIS